MSNNFLHPVSSDPAVNFLEGLNQNVASAMNNLGGVPAINSRQYYIRALRLLTKQNFAPELNFFATAAGHTTDPATNTFLSRWSWVLSSGEQIAASGLYSYYVDGLAIPYHDADTIGTVNPPTLHVILQNLSATAKTAAAAGSISLVAWLQPMSAF